MKSLIFILLMMCACTSPELKSPKAVLTTKAQPVYCLMPLDTCYDSANRFCSSGKWHQAVEPGMSFPSIIQEDGGSRFRMMITCQ